MSKASAAEPSGGLRFSLRSLLITTITICVLLIVIVPSFRAARQASLRMSCSDNLKLIATACLNYRDANRVFPCAITYDDDGKAMHSWRVLVLPYLESTGIYSAYDLTQPWNGPNNRLLGDGIPDTFEDSHRNSYDRIYDAGLYRCPGVPGSQDRMLTNYVMLIDDRPGQPNAPPNMPGSVPQRTDVGSTVIIVEIADTDIHWMEPRDVLLSELSLKINDRTRHSLSSYHGVVCIARADGSVEMLNESVTAERLQELLSQ